MANVGRTRMTIGLAWIVVCVGSSLANEIQVGETCTLAEAIQSANQKSAVGGCTTGGLADALILAADVNLLAQLPAIETDITIEGNGFAIQRADDPGRPSFRIFEVGQNGIFRLRHAKVRNGDIGSSRDSQSARMGELLSGGGIWIRPGGSAHLSDREVTDNTTSQSGGGVFSDRGTLVVERCVISRNRARFGGGIMSEGGVSVSESTISDNVAVTGGGFYQAAALGVPVREITTTTIPGNQASFAGGGIAADSPSTRLNVTNVTISNNQAGEMGGGIVSVFGAVVTLENTTLIGNFAKSGGGLYNQGRFEFDESEIKLINSVVADSAVGGACDGTIRRAGQNFDDDGTCASFSPVVPGVDIDTTLTTHGGPTRTHALFEGSVLIDAGVGCDLATDQRGYLRNDGACDVGAFEFGGALTVAMEMTDPVTASWNPIELAISYDVVVGHLGSLRSSRGDWLASTERCLANDLSGTAITFDEIPDADQGTWLLIRPVTALGNGSYDSSSAAQAAPRDAGLQMSPAVCP